MRRGQRKCPCRRAKPEFPRLAAKVASRSAGRLAQKAPDAATRMRHATVCRPAKGLRRAGLGVLPQLLLRGGDRVAARGSRERPQAGPLGSLAREDRAARTAFAARTFSEVFSLLARIRANRCGSCSARMSTFISSSSTPRPLIRITAPGRATTACQSRVR